MHAATCAAYIVEVVMCVPRKDLLLGDVILGSQEGHALIKRVAVIVLEAGQSEEGLGAYHLYLWTKPTIFCFLTFSCVLKESD